MLTNDWMNIAPTDRLTICSVFYVAPSRVREAKTILDSIQRHVYNISTYQCLRGQVTGEMMIDAKQLP